MVDDGNLLAQSLVVVVSRKKTAYTSLLRDDLILWEIHAILRGYI